jgi:hypothetical protein
LSAALGPTEQFAGGFGYDHVLPVNGMPAAGPAFQLSLYALNRPFIVAQRYPSQPGSAFQRPIITSFADIDILSKPSF